MIEKDVVINILEDIEQCLKEKNWQSKVISSSKQYRNGILISIDPEIKKIVEQQKQYDEDSLEAKELARKFSMRVNEIYNN